MISTAKRLDYTNYINSAEWQAVRLKAFEHYGKKCTKCGSENLLHVHHNTYKNFKHEKMKDLNVLCKECHMALHDRINKRKVIRLGKTVMKKESKKAKKKQSKQNNKQKHTKNKPQKTMAEIVLSLEQQQKNAEIKRLNKVKKQSKCQVHIGIGTPSQRGYIKPSEEPVKIEKPKINKPKKPKKSTNEYVRVKTWLDVIQESM